MKLLKEHWKNKDYGEIVNLDELQFGFMPGKGTVDILFVLKKKKKYRERKAYTCVC